MKNAMPILSNTLVLINLLLFLNSAHSQSIENLQNKLHEYMIRETNLGYSGTLLVAKDGKIIFSRGYGLADRARGIPVTPETIFTTGSITKQFTAAAILKLEMQGKLRVPDAISKYFDRVPEDKSQITLHHLLTHTAGFPPALGFDFTEISREQYVELAMNSPLEHTPGSEYAYSNVGYSLLAAIIELVAKQSYNAFVRENLFEPAGMTQTGYVVPNWNADNMAHGYRGDEDWGTFLDHPRTEDGPYWHLRGNGGILSTAGDMYRWHIALESNRILSDEYRQKLYKPYVREGQHASSFYGYGWSIVETPRGTRLITHNGGNPYFTADFLRYLDEDVVIYITSSSAERRATRISQQIARMVFGYDYTLPPLKIETLNQEQLASSEIGRRALTFLKLLGSQDEQNNRELINALCSSRLLKKYSPEKLLAALQADQEEIGAVNFGQAVKADDLTLELTVQSKQSGDWWQIRLQFEKQAPFKIDGIGIVDTLPPLAAGQTREQKPTMDFLTEKWGLPDSETGRRAAAILNAFESPNEDEIFQFVKSNYATPLLNQSPVEAHVKRFKTIQKKLGKFALTGATKTGGFSAKLSVQSTENEKAFSIRFTLEPGAPYRILEWHFEEH